MISNTLATNLLEITSLSFMTAKSALPDEGDEDDEDEQQQQSQPFGIVESDDDDDNPDSDDDNIGSDNNAHDAHDAHDSQEHQDPQESLQESLQYSQNLDKQRGLAVIAQLQAYDKLLEMRIGIQKAVNQVNVICADEDNDFVTGNEDDIQSTLSSLNELTESLFSIREKFIKYDSNTSIPPRKRVRLDDTIISNDSTIKEYPQQAAQDSFNLANSYEPHLIDTLKTTSNKVSLASTKGFSAVSKDAWSQVEDVMRELPKLRGRVGVRRGNNATTGQFEAEVFDDGDFYQTLLKEIIESKTGEANPEQPLKPNKNKVKKDIDTRATKGRKIKYNVHDKLQNFMVPIPPSKEAWPDSQITNWKFKIILEIYIIDLYLPTLMSTNIYLHTKSYLSTLQKFSVASAASTASVASAASPTPSMPSTPKLADASVDTEGITNTLINHLDNEDKDFEEKEISLRSNLASLIGRTPTDEEILQLMHAHKDDLTGAPFTQKRTPSRPVSRPSSRPWTPTQAPTTPTFGRVTPLVLSPSLSNAQMQSFLPPAVGSQPSSPLASPRPLNKRAAEFKPPGGTSELNVDSKNQANHPQPDEYDPTLDLGSGMTPLDVLWSIFAPSGVSLDELESTLTGNSFDFELTLNELSEKRSLAQSQAPPNNLSQRHQNPAGGRVCRYYLAGECRRSDCRFSHDIERALCRFWLRGNCIKQNCDFLHQLPPVQDVESTLTSMFETNANILAQQEREEHAQVQSVEDAFPNLHNARDNAQRKPYTPRWSTAVKVNPPQMHKSKMSGSGSGSVNGGKKNTRTSNLNSTSQTPRSSPRIKLRAPTLLPTLPTGSTLNALYMTYRNTSISLGTARNSLLSKAADAYRKGDGGAAKLFSKEAQTMNEQMSVENAQAASKLVKERRKAIQDALVQGAGTAGYEGDEVGRRSRGKACGNSLGVLLGMSGRDGLVSGDERMEAVLDLHGLHSNEGVEVLEEFLLALEKEHFLGTAFVLVGESKHTGTQDPLRGASKQRLNHGVMEFLVKWG
ncbi:hypothetical protein E3P91_02543 [Wallemia ichthyophaga]|nr:hypothetical protein E3P91_02543 [Wallemia ichthyophaga]TIB62252.1 hypothetical protein E3P78_02428 [Wallemia ichthyophaga]